MRIDYFTKTETTTTRLCRYFNSLIHIIVFSKNRILFSVKYSKLKLKKFLSWFYCAFLIKGLRLRNLITAHQQVEIIFHTPI